MVVALFLCEAAVMIVLAPEGPVEWAMIIVDAAAVAVLCFGLGYVLMAQPLRRAMDAQCESEQQLSAMFEHAPLGIVLTNPAGGIIRTNPAFRGMLGYDEAELRASCWQDITHPDDVAVNHGACDPVLRGEADRYELEKRYRCKDGRHLWSSLTVSAVRRHDRSLRMLVAMIADISARRRADELQRMAMAVFETSGEGMMITDSAGRIQFVNPAFTQITGYSPEDVIGETPALLSSGRHDKAFYADMWHALNGEGQWQGEVWNRRKDGTLFVEHLTISLLQGPDGMVANYIGVFGDVTRLQRRFEDAFQRANFDALTGLPNRALLWDRLTTGISKMRRDGEGLAVLFIDLDGFKPVNDKHGHLAGDELLRQMAARLRDCLRESDTLARLGGDEFVVVSLNSGMADAAARIGGKVMEAVQPPFILGDGIEAQVGASVGIALYPDHGDDPWALLAAADAAMYEAKRAGKGVWRLARDQAAVA